MSIHIDWESLLKVAIVSITATVLFTALLSGGIRTLALAAARSRDGRSATPARTAGAACLGLAGILVLFGLYLIVPLFH